MKTNLIVVLCSVIPFLSFSQITIDGDIFLIKDTSIVELKMLQYDSLKGYSFKTVYQKKSFNNTSIILENTAEDYFFAQLHISNPNKTISKVGFFPVEKSNINIKTDTLLDYLAIGTKNLELIAELHRFTYIKLKTIYEDSESLDESRINQTWKEYFEELKAFLGNNKLLWQYYAFVFLEYDLNDKILNFLVSNLGFFSSGSDIDKAILHEIYQKKKITIGTKIDNFCLGLSKSICLDKIKQTNIVFHFYADWCKPCITELPELEKIIKNTHNDSLFMFIVRVDNKKDDSRYLKGFEKMDNVRIVDDQIDEKSKISDFFLISDLPTNVWITNNLIIKGVKVGLNWLKNRL